MSSSVVDEVLFAYITVAPHAVNLVLIQVDSGIQWSVYYVSKYYMRPRFIIYHWKSHGVDYTRRIVKWGIVLRAFDIKYMPCISIKGHVLADLVAKFGEPLLEEVTVT